MSEPFPDFGAFQDFKVGSFKADLGLAKLQVYLALEAG